MKRVVQSNIFVARTRLGRQVKLVLFIAGVILPLGSLIWLALLTHGQALTRQRDDKLQTGIAPSAGD